jgi:hypothetical protein
MRLNPHRAVQDWQRKVGERFDELPLGFRRCVALTVVLVLVVSAVLLLTAAETGFAHARHAVQTQEHRRAVLIDIQHRGRAGTFHIIRVNGEDRELDFANFLPSDTIGTSVSYVVDPEDENHLIAIGTPEDWQDNAWNQFLASLFAAVCVLAFSGMTVARAIPEDVEAVEERLPPAPWAKYYQRRRPRHKKRRGGGTGRHSW